ncbi:PAS domain-containing protein [Fulvimarina endophytica]|uniref:PAS domain-containing protein n=1 Tax=Fulvimarina endophytica TaxID=2293836 RepID=A0A371X477_9HYPH|nr:methyl-accepting chemotaxis protein [Fulvimarina endophytica]RFC64042.1 PAS domain-containing protein [Fulvimarina endophytica]
MQIFRRRAGTAGETKPIPASALVAFASMAVPAFVLGRDGTVSHWNPACEALTGLKASEVLGTKDHWRGFYAAARPCLADLAFGDRPEAVAALYAAQERALDGINLRAQNWCDLPCGKRRYLLIDACPILNEAGEIAAVVETLQDMTASEEARLAEIAQKERQAQVVATIGAALKALAGGRLETRIDTRLPEEYEGLRSDFNAAVGALETAIAAVGEKAGSIRDGCSELAAAASDFAIRTEREAANVEKAAGEVSRISGAVTETSFGLDHARRILAETRSRSARSETVVQQTIASIQAIEASSEKISRIIGVIDEIAFQTSLLALNAGVEAARAGEAGRGFAIVAQEVRGLAQRSGDAAREIKALITSSGAEVADGSRLVGETGSFLKAIVAQVMEIDTLVAGLASAAEDQSASIREVNASVSDIESMVQQNAAMAEETSAASRSLTDETQDLTGLLSRFTTGDAGARSSPRRETAIARGSMRDGSTAARPEALRAGQSGHAAASRPPVVQMRTTGSGGAAEAPSAGDWDEF